MKNFRGREGDFIETSDGLILDVKGLVHPPDRTIAYLRYLEDSSGNRRRDGKNYLKVYSLSERERILRDRYPQYLCHDPVFDEVLEETPDNLISKFHQPAEKLHELLEKSHLDRIEAQSVQLAQILHDYTGVDFADLGISGSVLVNLQIETSDIDLVVYGRENCRRVYDGLRQLMQTLTSGIASYDRKDLEKLYDFRSRDTRIQFEDFLRSERRKVSQGKFGKRDFFVRFILDWNEISESYGDCLYKSVGYAKIKAEIGEAGEAIFTPCKYVLSNAETLEGTKTSLREIVSFRGRFCEQAIKGESVIAQGKVERVIPRNGAEYFRLVPGGKPSDFMIRK